MKSYCFIFLALCFLNGFAQDPEVLFKIIEPRKEIQTQINAGLKYPILKFKDSIVTQKINNFIFTDLKSKFGSHARTIPELLTELTEQRITDLNFEEIRNNKHLYSFVIRFEGYGAYPVSWATEYHFNKQTGSLITLEDLIHPNHYLAFLKILRGKHNELIEEHKTFIQSETDSGYIDKEDYEIIMRFLEKSCFENYDKRKFILSSDKLEVLIDCEFPHAWKALSPSNSIIFKKREVLRFFRSYYKKLF